MSGPNLSNLHGLIIGINNYKDPKHDRLKGCVSDATSIFNYITGDLEVPEDQLVCLSEGEATREGILEAFRSHLIDNEKINHSDPIVIYFAGHGSRYRAPPEWYSDDGWMELILPYDEGSGETGYTHGIPDRTLGALIYQLHQAKGDNITVILDCCYSGSGTRGCVRGRYSYDPGAPPIPPTLDEDIAGIKLQAPLAQAQHAGVVNQAPCKLSAPSLESHVLFAACKNVEQAQENQPRDSPPSGLFTTALLNALRECNLGTTSYAGLIRSVQKHVAMLMLQISASGRTVNTQTPQCEGQKQDRLLFQTQFALCKGMIRLDYHPRNHTFHIKAGNASGIQLGAELDVYSESQSTPLTRLVATQVTATSATLSLLDTGAIVQIPQNAYVVVAKYTGQAIRILKNDKIKLPPHWQDVFYKVKALPIDIVWAKPGEASDLVLEATEWGVLLHRQDPYIIQLEPRDILLEHRLSIGDLTHKLSAIAHFHFHLQRRNPNSPLQDNVRMKLVELERQGPSHLLGVKEYVPVTEKSEDLFGDSLATGKVARLKATPEKRYGLQLTNNSNWPLFAWVLYFDLEDYSISFLYTPPSQGTNPPLSTSGKELAVGYGSSGVEPLRVDNSGYSKRESGIFMLFVSSTWVDVAHMGQKSIFERVSEADARDDKKGTYLKPGSEVWDVFVVGVSISQ